MKKDYTRKIEEAQKGAPYVATRTKGKEGHFEEYNLEERFKRLESKYKYVSGFLNSFAGMMKEQLEKNGIQGTKSATNNVYKMLDGMEVILKDEEVHAMQFGALGKYVTAYIDATHIYHGTLPEDFSADGTWFKNEHDVYVRDMQKVAEAVL